MTKQVKNKQAPVKRRSFWRYLNPGPLIVMLVCFAVAITGMFPNGWMGW